MDADPGNPQIATIDSPIPAPVPPTVDYATRKEIPWRVYALRSLAWLAIALILILALRGGLSLRKWVFVTSQPIRFVFDDDRAVYWGLMASGPEGYLNQYDKMEPQIPETQDSNWIPWLDYAPFRLLVMTEWGKWQRTHFPPDADRNMTEQYQRSYDFNHPVLIFNTCMEAFAAICAFLLTRLWVIRSNGNKPLNHFDGVWQGAVAALLLWFNLDILLSAHAWIQWDSWAIPWYLGAALLASLDWWLMAGVALAIGAMFKGQQFAIAPIFIIWPLVQRRVGAALRWIIGLTFGIGLIVSPWMLTYLPAGPLAAARAEQQGQRVADYRPDLFAIPRHFDAPAAIWIAGMLLLAGALPWLARTLRDENPPIQNPTLHKIAASKWSWITAAGIIIFAATFWPFLARDNRQYWVLGLAGGATLAASALFLSPKKLPCILAATTGAALLSCMFLFHGSQGWLKCSFEFGPNHWPFLTMGTTSNIPALFSMRFGWPNDANEIAFTLPAIHAHWPAFLAANGWWPAVDFDVSEKRLFATIYAVFLILSGIAIGLQARRNDRRMLVALITPWIMFFLIPAQIHERYLIFASGASAICIGAGVGPALLGYSLTLFSAMIYMNRLLSMSNIDLDQFGQNLSNSLPKIFSPDAGHTMQQYLAATHPDIAWGIAVVALVFLYLSLAPSAGFRWREQTAAIDSGE
jgi:hypothetical protein